MPISLGRHSYVVGINNHFDVPINVGNFTSISHDVQIVGSEHQRLVSTFPFRERWAARKIKSLEGVVVDEVCLVGNENVFDYPLCKEAKPITIGNDVWIGQGAVIFQGSTIADGCIIGAYCVVKGTTDPYGIYVGNPKRVIDYRFRDVIVKMLLRMKWWDWSDESVAKALPHFNNPFDLKEFAIKEGLICEKDLF